LKDKVATVRPMNGARPASVIVNDSFSLQRTLGSQTMLRLLR
jgi:hypothetical protein